jgi:hypothetical protein
MRGSVTEGAPPPRYDRSYVPRPRALVKETRGDATQCPRCGIEIGEGPGKQRLALDSAICIECAIDLFPPLPDEFDPVG